ncbi:MAG: NAD-dependent epimerase/dehydratase family protein [Anaerolineae bacterium]
MRILVTGGTGSVGHETVRQLLQHGHQVRVIGRRSEQQISGADYRPCDVNDFPSLREQVREMEAIIHLAAIPHPGMGSGPEIFRTNCAGTFNVYQAAAEAGIKRVVTASSINAFGFNFGIKDFTVQYLPIDEEHPTCTSDPYSFSKQVTEDIADYYWRREGISGVCLRLPAVIDARSGWAAWRVGVRHETEALFRLLQQEDKSAGTKHLQAVFALLQKTRENRANENHFSRGMQRTPEALIMIGYTNFWTGLDTRDTAQALEKGVLAEYEGSHTLFVNDNENIVGIPSAELASTFFPQVLRYKTALEGNQSLVSIERARCLIGFEPEYHLAQMGS